MVTPTVNIHEAKTHLSRLVDQAAKGREFVIAKAGPDGHFKFPHLWPLKLPQAGRSDYGFPDPV